MYNQETKNCQNCKKDFIIEPEDFEFYEKIKVPAPTWCPECRMMRRFLWRNERSLYKRNCALCDKGILSVYSLDKPFFVYCAECWWSDKWESLVYGVEYDFSRPFFSQFKNLAEKVPFLNLWAFNNTNAEYGNYDAYCNNIYLTVSAINSEDIFFSTFTDKSKDCFDCYRANESELCYEDNNIIKSYNSHFLFNCRECTDSWFLFDCVNCQNCFLSNNLRNKKFYIENKPYSKEEYFKKIKEFNTGSHNSLKELRNKFNTQIIKGIRKFADITKSLDASGDYISNSKNVKDSYLVDGGENLKYCWRTPGTKDSYDVAGCMNNELIYEASVAADHWYMGKFYTHSKNNQYSEFTYFCTDSSHLFACIGLRNKQYCILNKQYTPESYKETVERIKEHMNTMPYIDSKGRIYKYGEFFPPELSPFSYNETVAQEYFPLTKEQAISQGYRWKEKEERNIQITMTNDQIPDHIKDVPDSIVNEIIQCSHAIPRESASNNSSNPRSSASTCNEQCTEAFKIIQSELDFYRKMNLPLPRLCPNCRHYQRIKQRNPLRLWHRKCMCQGAASGKEKGESEKGYQNTIEHFHGDQPCPNEFETTYSPDRPEIVYCEKCYNAEVV